MEKEKIIEKWNKLSEKEQKEIYNSINEFCEVFLEAIKPTIESLIQFVELLEPFIEK